MLQEDAVDVAECAFKGEACKWRNLVFFPDVTDVQIQQFWAVFGFSEDQKMSIKSQKLKEFVAFVNK